ncbi:unnamed protein product, partial [Heterotrigona itama]
YNIDKSHVRMMQSDEERNPEVQRNRQTGVVNFVARETPASRQ